MKPTNPSTAKVRKLFGGRGAGVSTKTLLITGSMAMLTVPRRTQLPRYCCNQACRRGRWSAPTDGHKPKHASDLAASYKTLNCLVMELFSHLLNYKHAGSRLPCCNLYTHPAVGMYIISPLGTGDGCRGRCYCYRSFSSATGLSVHERQLELQ